MYIYNGKNPDSKEQIQKEFEDDYDAIEFANNNFYKFPKSTITDVETDDIIWSDIMAEEELKATDDMMFPDKESREGYDPTKE